MELAFELVRLYLTTIIHRKSLILFFCNSISNVPLDTVFPSFIYNIDLLLAPLLVFFPTTSDLSRSLSLSLLRSHFAQQTPFTHQPSSWYLLLHAALK